MNAQQLTPEETDIKSDSLRAILRTRNRHEAESLLSRTQYEENVRRDENEKAHLPADHWLRSGTYPDYEEYLKTIAMMNVTADSFDDLFPFL